MRIHSFFAFVLFLLTMPTALADEVFKVENDQSEWKSVTVKTIEHRPTTSMYVVRGKVQYRDIEGNPYLEMWNIMPDGNRYFSRLQVMEPWAGRKSGWRKFELPFNLLHHKPELVTLEINVVMPGKGTIELSELTVSDQSLWFSGPTGGVLGGVLGTVLGLCGAVTGCLCGFLVPRGKGRRLIFGLFLFWTMMGVVTLIIGVSALCLGQPYHVWYPFVLCGGLFLFLVPHTFFAIKKGYAQAELRKMQALDA